MLIMVLRVCQLEMYTWSLKDSHCNITAVIREI